MKRLKKFNVFFKQTPCEQEAVVEAKSMEEAIAIVKDALTSLDIPWDEVTPGWEIETKEN